MCLGHLDGVSRQELAARALISAAHTPVTCRRAGKWRRRESNPRKVPPWQAAYLRWRSERGLAAIADLTGAMPT